MKKAFRPIVLNISLILITSFIVNCGPAPGAAPQEVNVDPLRFADVVAGFKSADSLKKPRSNSVLFVGSSSIRGWKTLSADFPELNVLNRGFGGSHMSDLLFYMDDLVFPYRPNAIVVYEGDNDIAAGKTPERVLSDYNVFVERVLEIWPNQPIFFISIKPSLARVNYMGNMAKANALIKARTEEGENLYFIDVYTPMLSEDGTPRKDIFGHDGLHMNEVGYALWTKEVKAELGL
ncbi:MAG: hypothetical protein HOD43_03190 [Candidatus Marinimicrobia bacterium]|jgi:lysophospholipase L1-like esterase|nr:hypothetical protein [Candidatus Neomarinimicrobiota bacterium]MBT3632668.1 hypothetical protein [Candidatus Neomarinimicrobiota bacterium]MBT3823770.1 hypothetical protein [Candidatus Neomarinimicrobiota bacterium]MBT4130752.1 hypothetical protein [Candidatus Neomarinimicrobiota bacterium]MBT4294791.1 hypothetical protein [Candidatus Neomarinimicrobiota bacterium]